MNGVNGVVEGLFVLRLIRLQHANFAPFVEEDKDAANPGADDQHDNDHLVLAHLQPLLNLVGICVNRSIDELATGTASLIVWRNKIDQATFIGNFMVIERVDLHRVLNARLKSVNCEVAEVLRHLLNDAIPGLYWTIYDLEGIWIRLIAIAGKHPLDANSGRVPTDEDDRDILRSGQNEFWSLHGGRCRGAAQIRRRRRQIVVAFY